MMYALIAPVLVFGAGAAIDYGRAAQIHTKLNAAADAAALAALTPAMLQQSATVAQTAANTMFIGLANGVSGLTANATQVTVTVTTGATPLTRNVQVSYSTSVNTIFAQVLGVAQLPVQGSSQASAQAPPNIDFYVLLDNSSSMALPATTAGITQMQNLTLKQDTGGCAFACHQASTNNGDTAGNPCADGTAPTLNSSMAKASPASSAIYCNVSKHGAQIDNYQLARNNSITLRLDELNSGVSTLLQTASTTAQSSQFSTPPKYRFSIYSMDPLWSIGLNQLDAADHQLYRNWTTASANFGVMEMYSNNNDCANRPAPRARRPGATSPPTTTIRSASSARRATSPIPATAPTRPATRRRKCCSSSPTASRTKRAGEAALSRRSTISATRPYGNSSRDKLVHDDQESRDQDRNPLYRLSGRARQQLVRNPYRADPVGHRPGAAGLRVPGLFYDAAIGADLGQALPAVRRGDPVGASDQLRRDKRGRRLR